MSWRPAIAALLLSLMLSACGGGGSGGGSGAFPVGLSFDVDLAGNLRALPRPTMGALEAS